MNTKFYFLFLFLVICFSACDKDEQVSKDEAISNDELSNGNKQEQDVQSERTLAYSYDQIFELISKEIANQEDPLVSISEKKVRNIVIEELENQNKNSQNPLTKAEIRKIISSLVKQIYEDASPYKKINLEDLDDYLLNNQSQEISIEVSKVIDSSVGELTNILKKYSGLKIHLKIEKNFSLTQLTVSYFNNIESLVSLIVPEGVEELSLANCNNLEDLQISNTVKYFSLFVCKKIKVLDIPASVEGIYVKLPSGMANGGRTVPLFYSCPIEEITVRGKIISANLDTRSLTNLKFIRVPNDLVDYYKELWKIYRTGDYTSSNNINLIKGY